MFILFSTLNFFNFIQDKFILHCKLQDHYFLNGKTARAKPDQNCPQNINETTISISYNLNLSVTLGPLFLEWENSRGKAANV